jgi:hypothetical protein
MTDQHLAPAAPAQNPSMFVDDAVVLDVSFLITVLGSIGFIFNAGVAVYYLTNSKQLINDPGSEALIGGILDGCVASYYARRLWHKRAGCEPGTAFTTIPPEQGANSGARR